MSKETKIVDETKKDISIDVRKSAVFYEQWYQIVKDFSPEERDKAYKYIFEYAFYGIEPEKDKTNAMSYVVFRMAKPNIDSAQRRYDTALENGNKGGRPKKVTEEVLQKIVELRKQGLTQNEVALEVGLSLKTIQRVEKDISQNHNVNDNVNVNENENCVASDEDNTGLADAQTVASLPTKEFDFQANDLSNEQMYSIIDNYIKQGHNKDEVLAEFAGTKNWYKCNEQAVSDCYDYLTKAG